MKPAAVAKFDAGYQAKISDVLAEVCAVFEAGNIDGVYIVTRERIDGKMTLNYRRASMMDMDVSWAAVQTLLVQHLERI